MRSRPGVRSLLLLVTLSGCTEVGPDFVTPEAPVADVWTVADDPQIETTPPEDPAWWKALDDAELSELIEAARRANPTVQSAGVRVLQARAQLAATVGELYPQQQQAFGDVRYQRLSEGDVLPKSVSSFDNSFWGLQFGIGASWEIDFWGKFRRAIEAADASLMASIAGYDNALVSLTAEVASTYVSIRTFQERLRIARENVEIQRTSLRLAEVRYRDGQTSQTDVEQAKAEYAQTRSEIPQLEIGLRQNLHALSVLLGRPPADLEDLVGEIGPIPSPPPEVAIGIPAELLRRRPDIRAAEQAAAAQSALIGATKADLYPAVSLSGTFGFLSTDIGNSNLLDAFDWKSRVVSFGPAVVWNVLNYGQITNQVRAQDAAFQEAVLSYQNTVLQAQQEVADALVSFLGNQEAAALLLEAVAAAKRSVQLATIEYREGAAGYTTVLVAQQNLLQQQDQLAVTQGGITQALISLYRALGGGWQTWEGAPFVSAAIKQMMAARTNWGGLLEDETLGSEAVTSPVPEPVF